MIQVAAFGGSAFTKIGTLWLLFQGGLLSKQRRNERVLRPTRIRAGKCAPFHDARRSNSPAPQSSCRMFKRSIFSPVQPRRAARLSSPNSETRLSASKAAADLSYFLKGGGPIRSSTARMIEPRFFPSPIIAWQRTEQLYRRSGISIYLANRGC